MESAYDIDIDGDKVEYTVVTSQMAYGDAPLCNRRLVYRTLSGHMHDCCSLQDLADFIRRARGSVDKYVRLHPDFFASLAAIHLDLGHLLVEGCIGRSLADIYNLSHGDMPPRVDGNQLMFHTVKERDRSGEMSLRHYSLNTDTLLCTFIDEVFPTSSLPAT